MASYFQTMHMANNNNNNNKSTSTTLTPLKINVRKVAAAEVSGETPKMGSFMSQTELEQAERTRIDRRLARHTRINGILRTKEKAPKNGITKGAAQPTKAWAMAKAVAKDEKLQPQKKVARRVSKKIPVWGEVPEAVRRENELLEMEREKEYEENKEKADEMRVRLAKLEMRRHRRVALCLRPWK